MTQYESRDQPHELYKKGTSEKNYFLWLIENTIEPSAFHSIHDGLMMIPPNTSYCCSLNKPLKRSKNTHIRKYYAANQINLFKIMPGSLMDPEKSNKVFLWVGMRIWHRTVSFFLFSISHQNHL